MKNLEELENKFKNKDFFANAFVHRSYLNESEEHNQSNERLEYLGDAVLELIISEHIYKKFPTQPEGYLTSLRANLVNTKNLSAVGKRLKLGERILMSKGEEEGGGRQNTSLLANTFEALVGAIYLDLGLATTEKFVREHVLSELPKKLSEPLKDAKSRLQEEVQKKGMAPPKYKTVREKGPDHAKEFLVEALVEKKVLGKGKGASKSEAQQAAATAALVKLASKS